MINYSIGSRIKELRLQRHLSQEQLALRAGITTAYLGQIERGLKNPTVKLVEKISDVFNVSLSELFSNQELSIKDTDEVLELINFELQGMSESEKKEVLEIIRHTVKFKLIS